MIQKKLYTLLLIGGLWWNNESVAQKLNFMENEPIDSAQSAQLIVCKLSGPELQKRKEALRKEVFASLERSERLENGYIFHFLDKEGLLIKIADYMVAEHECCPFFDFDLAVRSGRITWTIAGPPEAVTMIESFIKD